MKNQNFQLSLSSFFFRIYMITALSIITTLTNIYIIKYYLIPTLAAYNYLNILINFSYLIQLILLGSFIFFSYKLQSLINSINENKSTIYCLFALLCLIQSFLFCPIFIITNNEILRISLNYSIIIFIVCSIIGVMLETNLNKITKIIWTITMLLCLYLFFANFFTTISLNQLLIISIIFLGSSMFMLMNTTQRLKDLYYSSNTDLDGLIILGAFIIQQQFFNILINIIRILLIISQKNKNKNE